MFESLVVSQSHFAACGPAALSRSCCVPVIPSWTGWLCSAMGFHGYPNFVVLLFCGFFYHVESSLVKLFFLKRPSEFFSQGFLESVVNILKKKNKLANHTINNGKRSRSDSEINKTLGDSRRVFRLCHFIRLKKWSRKHQLRDLKVFSFYASSHDKQHWFITQLLGILHTIWVLEAQCVCVAQSDLSSGQSLLTLFPQDFTSFWFPVQVFLFPKAGVAPAGPFPPPCSCPVLCVPSWDPGATSCVTTGSCRVCLE